MRNRIDDVLTTLYDYEYIDIERLYNDKYFYQMIMEFENGNDEFNQEIYDQIADFIKFETNYNSDIGDF